MVLGRAGLCLLVIHLWRMLGYCRTKVTFLYETVIVCDFPRADLGFAQYLCLCPPLGGLSV